MSWYSGGFLSSLESPAPPSNILIFQSITAWPEKNNRKSPVSSASAEKTQMQRWSSNSKNRAGRKARLFIPCLVPVQFCPTNIEGKWLGSFQSLYLALIISLMNKKSLCSQPFWTFFFPSSWRKEVKHQT